MSCATICDMSSCVSCHSDVMCYKQMCYMTCHLCYVLYDMASCVSCHISSHVSCTHLLACFFLSLSLSLSLSLPPPLLPHQAVGVFVHVLEYDPSKCIAPSFPLFLIAPSFPLFLISPSPFSHAPLFLPPSSPPPPSSLFPILPPSPPPSLISLLCLPLSESNRVQQKSIYNLRLCAGAPAAAAPAPARRDSASQDGGAHVSGAHVSLGHVCIDTDALGVSSLHFVSLSLSLSLSLFRGVSMESEYVL